LRRRAAENGVDVVVAGADGAVAFDAVFAAVERGVQMTVANEELIVAAVAYRRREDGTRRTDNVDHRYVRCFASVAIECR